MFLRIHSTHSKARFPVLRNARNRSASNARSKTGLKTLRCLRNAGNRAQELRSAQLLLMSKFNRDHLKHREAPEADDCSQYLQQPAAFFCPHTMRWQVLE